VPISISVNAVELKASVHGKQGLSCSSCHPDIKGYPHPVLDTKDCRDFDRQRSLACATCHSTIAASQKDSVHSRLSGNGNGDAPTCVDCHGGHNVTPPDQPRSRLSQTCGQSSCHDGILSE
jgi:hypothetical protein